MGWEEDISIPTRERCGVCHKVSAVGFHVPDKLWRVAVPDHYRDTVLCVPCFVSFADERMLPWDREIRFYPVSLRGFLTYVRDLLPDCMECGGVGKVEVEIAQAGDQTLTEWHQCPDCQGYD